jgi:hypothetical protein
MATSVSAFCAFTDVATKPRLLQRHNNMKQNLVIVAALIAAEAIVSIILILKGLSLWDNPAFVSIGVAVLLSPLTVFNVWMFRGLILKNWSLKFLRN